MNRVRPIKVTKVRQLHAAERISRPGRPIIGPNYVAQREPSAKKNARSAARSRKAAKAA